VVPASISSSGAIAGVRLSKRYGGVQALLDVSVAALGGEVLGIVGENGAGKSTLVKILSGLVRPDSGTLLMTGHEVHFHGPRDAQHAGVRIAPQELVLCPELSITENLLSGELPRSRLGGFVVDWPRAHREAVQRLAQLGVDHLDVRKSVGGLTVVERAFVQLARAMDARARVIITDEPTAPMSRPEVEQTLRVLARIKESGVAVVYVSHRLQEVFQLCDRVVVLRNGELVGTFEKTAITSANLVGAMLSGRDLDPGSSAGASVDAEERLLEVEGIHSSRIHRLSLHVNKGEIVAVYGTLGSGREELGRALIGLTGRSGSLRILGRTISRPNPRKVIQAGVGYVPAERRSQGLVLEKSIRENLSLGTLGKLSRRGVLNRRKEARLAANWVEALRIAAPSVEAPVGVLSGGSQQKVLLARWLASGSRVLILEEPTRGVDIATKAEIYRILHDHVLQGGAVLLISSDLEEVARIPARVLVMRSGEIVGELSRASEEEIAAAALVA
jgi:ABC-type sugar transport system ATPase subunit